MRIIEPYFEILDELDGKKMLQKIERIGRVCYKSEGNIKEGSAETFRGFCRKVYRKYPEERT